MRYDKTNRSIILAAVLSCGGAAFGQYQQPPYPQPQAVPQQYPQPAPAQTQYGQPQQAPQPLMSADDLDTLLAPIALYPDSLLSQVLMASTYPLEVVQAQRFVTATPNLTGDAMADALAQQNWDPSVKSLTNFPSVLQMMNDKLDWTVQLGNAFLAQQKDVMDSAQRLRQQAQAAGNLQTNDYQRVQYLPAEETPAPQAEPQYIVIQDAQPDYVYVPVYDPLVIYGTWQHRDRPWFWHPHDYEPSRGVWWGSRYQQGPGWGYAWGQPDWRRHDLDVDINRHNNIDIRANRADIIRDEHINVTNGRGQWQHDPDHRNGVAYGDRNTADRYRGRAPDNNVGVRRDDHVDRNTVRDARDSKDNDVDRNNVRNADQQRDVRTRTDSPRSDSARSDSPRSDQQRIDSPKADRQAQQTPAKQGPQRSETEKRDTPPASATPAPSKRVPAPAATPEPAPAPKRAPAPADDPAPAPKRVPAPAENPAPAPKRVPAPAPAPQAQPDRPTNPRATPPDGSGVRGGGDARGESGRGRDGHAAPAPAPAAPSGGSSGGK